MNDNADEHLVNDTVAFVASLNQAQLDRPVRHQFLRSFVDSVGCIVGGSRHPAVQRATQAVTPFFGPVEASLLGQGAHADLLHAPLINGLAGATYSFFDSYSTAHLHAGVVHAAALLAVAERTESTGSELLSAYIAGVEVACRLTLTIAVPPAQADIGWSVGGIVCGLSAALAAARLLHLTEQQLTWAMGIAASEAAGTRAEQGAMTAGLIYGQAAQIGVRSAILASKDFTSSARSITGKHGWAQMFSHKPDLHALTDELGVVFRGTRTTFKPFPTDIAIHPSIDAMLQLKNAHGFRGSDITGIRVTASDLAATFCDRPSPVDELEAKFSLQHWVAAAAVHGRAQLEQGHIDVVRDHEVARLRSATTVTADPAMPWDAVDLTVELTGGPAVRARIEHCVGSPDSPMTDDAITDKFVDQTALTIGTDRAQALVEQCWNVADMSTAKALTQRAR